MTGYERRRIERMYEIERQRQEAEAEREFIRLIFGPMGDTVCRMNDFVWRHPIILVGIFVAMFAMLCMMGGPDLY